MANRESEIRAFTGLRGLACFYVMLYHFGFAGILPKDFSAFANHGYLSVDIFFVLSGFVMAMVYGDYFKNGFDFDNELVCKSLRRRYRVFNPVLFFFLFHLQLPQLVVLPNQLARKGLVISVLKICL